MSVCITIVSNQLETVVNKLDNKKFKYKFLYESDDKYKERLNSIFVNPKNGSMMFFLKILSGFLII